MMTRLSLLFMALAQTGPGETFTLHQLHPRVYAAVVVDRPAEYAFSNSLVVVGDSGVLVVDTQASPDAARALIRIVRSFTDIPVRWVVNTHWHGDHVQGNVAYREAFPGVTFLGHRSLVEDVPDRTEAARLDEMAKLPASIEDRRRWLRENSRGGVPLDSAARAAVAYSAHMRERYLDQLLTLRLIPPDVVIDDSMTLSLGGISVRLVHAGPAHTRGDVAVHVPEAGVLAVGDLLEWGLPWLQGACVAGWAAALRRLGEVQATSIVMSHGPTATPPFLEAYAELLGAITEQKDLGPFYDGLSVTGVTPATFDRFAVAAASARADSGAACATSSPS